MTDRQIEWLLAAMVTAIVGLVVGVVLYANTAHAQRTQLGPESATEWYPDTSATKRYPVVDVTHPDFGAIPNDGNRDDTAINNAIDSLPPRGGVIDVRGGTFILGGRGASRRNLIDIQRSNVYLSIGPESVLKLGDSFYETASDTGHLIRIGREDHSLSNVWVDGNGSAVLDGDTDNQATDVGTDDSSLVAVFGDADRVKFQNFEILRAPNTAFWIAGQGPVSLGSGGTGDTIDQLRIEGVSVRDSGEGINFFLTRNLKILRTEWINMTKQDAIEPNAESHDWLIHDVTVRGADQSCLNPFVQNSAYSNTGGTVRDFTFSNCARTVENGIAVGGDGIFKDLQIVDGTVKHVHRGGNAKAVSFETNVQESSIKGVSARDVDRGFRLDGPRNKIEDGSVFDADEEGVRISNQADSSGVSGVAVRGAKQGIQVRTDHNILTDITVGTGAQQGIVIEGNNNTIRGGQVFGRSNAGIELKNDADSNVVEGVRTHSNTGDGLTNTDLASDSNTVRFVWSYKNGGFGIDLQNAEGNQLLYNTMFGNTSGAIRDQGTDTIRRGNTPNVENAFEGFVEADTVGLRQAANSLGLSMRINEYDGDLDQQIERSDASDSSDLLESPNGESRLATPEDLTTTTPTAGASDTNVIRIHDGSGTKRPGPYWWDPSIGTSGAWRHTSDTDGVTGNADIIEP